MSAKIFRALPLLVCLVSIGCAGTGRRSGAPAPDSGEYDAPVIQEPVVEGENVPEAYGPSAPPEGVPAPAPPAEAKREDARLCLVLGPGMAKALAHASVLEAIRKAQIPVHCVVGTEMGAVVGALYAHSNGSTNNLQWQLFKLNKDNYFNFPMISLRDPRSSGRKLHEYLRGIFKAKRIEDLPILFATAAVKEDSDSTVYFERGDLVHALSASLAVKGIFEPWKVGGEEYESAANASPAPVELARKLGGNFIVLVDVIEDGAGAPKGGERFQKAFATAKNLMRFQKKEASYVIQVRAGASSFDDFGRQGEIYAAGARAAEASVPELKAAWERFSAASR